MSDGPVCIRHAASLEEAEIIVAWLDQQGVDARVVDPSNTGTWAFGVTDPEGIEIYVRDEATAQKARTLLEEHDRRRRREAGEDDMVAVSCPACGEQAEYTADLRGTTQECPECGNHLDVPETAAG